MTDAPDADPLDAAIDEALERLTAVDGLESPARARTLARLAEVDAPAAPAFGLEGRRGWRPWLVAAPALAAVLAIVAVTWMTVWPTRPTALETTVTRAGEPATAPQPEAPQRETTQPSAPSREPGAGLREPGTGSRRPAVRAASRATAPRTVTTRRPAPTPRPVRPDPLVAFLDAVKQLPPDVWERVDAAGPPVVSELASDTPAPIAPIAIDHLPDSEWTVAPPTVTFPGEPR